MNFWRDPFLKEKYAIKRDDLEVGAVFVCIKSVPPYNSQRPSMFTVGHEYKILDTQYANASNLLSNFFEFENDEVSDWYSANDLLNFSPHRCTGLRYSFVKKELLSEKQLFVLKMTGEFDA